MVGYGHVYTASNWTDSVLAIVAAWTGQSKVIPASLVGGIAINHLLLLGVCFIHGGYHMSETKYLSMMASIHARLLPAAVAILVCATSANAWSGGKHSQYISFTVGAHVHLQYLTDVYG